MPCLVFGAAQLFEVAAIALGFAGIANLSAMVDDLVREGDPVILGNDLHQLLLDLLGGVAFGQFEAVGDAENVRIDHYAFGLAKADAENHIGCFAGCAGNGGQLCNGLRDLATELLGDFPGRALY